MYVLTPYIKGRYTLQALIYAIVINPYKINKVYYYDLIYNKLFDSDELEV